MHFEYVSILVLIPALLHGTYFDIKTRTAPKYIWTLFAPVGLFFTLLWYVYNFYWNGFNAILPVFVTGLILSTFCMIMAYRRGNGGDWRALFWICVIVPWVAIYAVLLSAVFGCVQSAVDKFILKKTKGMAWMVSITAAYLVSAILYVAGLS